MHAKGHLCLWREDSLKEKYNTKFQNYFLFNFPCIQVSFDGQKHIFWLFLLCLRPHTSAGMNIKDALLQIYHDYGQLVYVLFLQP